MNAMTPFSVLIVALATWQIIEIWHHGSIFATLRARLELSESKFAELLLCPFCLSPYVALLCVGMMQVFLIEFIPLIFAVARLANLFNDLAHKITRTPGKGVPPTIDWAEEQRLMREEELHNSAIEEKTDGQ